jgi:hypothetical protein
VEDNDDDEEEEAEGDVAGGAEEEEDDEDEGALTPLDDSPAAGKSKRTRTTPDTANKGRRERGRWESELEEGHHIII